MSALAVGIAASERSAEAPATDEGEYILYLADHGLTVIQLKIDINGQSSRGAMRRSLLAFCGAADRDRDGWLTGEEFDAGVAGHPFWQEMRARDMQRSGMALARPSFGTTNRLPVDVVVEFLARYVLTPLKFEFAGQQLRRISDGGEFLDRPIADIRLFERLDTDGNKKLTARELEQAARVLNKLDFNEDEIISVDELRQRAVPAGMPAAGRMNAAPRGDGHLIHLSPERIDAQFVRRVLSTYDGEAKGSVKDLRLDRNELDLPAELFANSDQDSDGYWDFDELERFLRQPVASLEILVHLATEAPGSAIPSQGANDDVSDPADPRSWAEFGNAVDHQSQSKVFVPGLLKFDIHGARFSLRVTMPGEEASRDEALTSQFRTLDADKNEYLDPAEFKPLGEEETSPAAFQAIDQNRDEKIYLPEFLSFHHQTAELQRNQMTLNIENLGRTLFGPLDANSDGQLSQRELATLKNRLPEWDLDHDGKLTEAEIPQQYRLTLTRGPRGAGLGGAARSGFNDGGDNLGSQVAGPTWFRKMDRNQDGEVSAREFLGTAERFRQIDANGDGAIDADEAAAVK